MKAIATAAVLWVSLLGISRAQLVSTLNNIPDSYVPLQERAVAAVNAMAIPEPSFEALALVGAASLYLARRRVRRSQLRSPERN